MGGGGSKTSMSTRRVDGVVRAGDGGNARREVEQREYGKIMGSNERMAGGNLYPFFSRVVKKKKCDL